MGEKASRRSPHRAGHLGGGRARYRGAARRYRGTLLTAADHLFRACAAEAACEALIGDEVAPLHAMEGSFKPEIIAADLLDRLECEPDVFRGCRLCVLDLARHNGFSDGKVLLKQPIPYSLSQVELRTAVEDVVPQ